MIDIPSNLTDGASTLVSQEEIEELGDVVKILIPKSITKRQARQ